MYNDFENNFDINDIDNVNTDLSLKANKIEYPFMFIENVSRLEFNYLLNKLPDGNVPLMLKDGNTYCLIKNVSVNLETYKHLMRFKKRDIIIKQSKNDSVNFDKMLTMLLLEG